MNEAPERVWICPEDETWQSGQWDLGPDGQGPEAEYIRADLVQAAVAAALTEAADVASRGFHPRNISDLIKPDAQAALDRVVEKRVAELKGQNDE